MAGSGQCAAGSERDGRHANRRGFPGLAPPRCHPGPPSLSLSESSSPARECAQGRGAGRGGQTSPRRDPSSFSSSSSRRGRGALRSRRGRGAGRRGWLLTPGPQGDSRAAERAQRSARGDGRRPKSEQPAGCSCGRAGGRAGGGGAGGPGSPRGRQGWEPVRRQSALGSGRRSWRPQLLPGASSRLSPPREAPSSPALHLPLATPAESLRAALPQPSRETGGRGRAEQRGAHVRGWDRHCRSDQRGVGKRRDDSQLPHTGTSLARPATQPPSAGEAESEGCRRSIWARLAFTAPRPGSHASPIPGSQRRPGAASRGHLCCTPLSLG